MEKTASIKYDKEQDKVIIRRFDGIEVEVCWIKIEERRDHPEKFEKETKILFEQIVIEIDRCIAAYVEELHMAFAKTQKKIIH